MAISFYHVEGDTTYSTATAAHSAANNGDTINLNRVSGFKTHYEQLTYTKGLNWIAPESVEFKGYIRPNFSGGVTGDAYFKNILFSLDAAMPFANMGAYDLTFESCILAQDSNNNIYQFTGTNSRFIAINTVFLYSATYSLQGLLFSTTAIDARFLNCTIIDRTDNGIFRCASSATLQVYNSNLQTTGAIENAGTANASQDYNVTSSAWANGGGANNQVLTSLTSGLMFALYPTIGNIGDYRTNKPEEIAGTDNPNVTIGPLSALYTTDIDGRTRTTYAIGCSEGYQTASDPDDVLKSAGGNYNDDNLIDANVKLSTLYGLASTGSYDNASDPDEVISSAGGNWVDTNLIPATVKLATTYGIAEVGTYDPVIPPSDPPQLDRIVPTDGGFDLYYTASDESNVIYARVRRESKSLQWSARSEVFKRTGSGVISVTGLINGVPYDTAGEEFNGGCYSVLSNVATGAPDADANATSRYQNKIGVRDNNALGFLQVAQSIGDSAVFTNVGEAAITIYVIPSTNSTVLDVKNGSINLHRTEITVPRQTNFPPDKFFPGALINLNDRDYQVGEVEGDQGSFEFSSVFTLPLNALGDSVGY